MHGDPQAFDATSSDKEDRRAFLGHFPACLMAGGLAAGYGTMGAIALRFLYPAHLDPTAWVFVVDLRGVQAGDSIATKAPSGQPIIITRMKDEGTAEDFIALSSVCPHLGCMVHWEGQNNRFFCPCHNGVFDPLGIAIEGPPHQSGQTLARFPLKVENGLLFMQVPLANLS